MRNLHLVSHTHWDREWYLTFQQFRLKLVKMLDNLLELLENDSDFKHFMLDGQTIVLDDYLEMRPEQEYQARKLIEEGRLLIGPWYVLPDEFLVSPEAIIRNLLEGQHRARDLGGTMQVGYIPDPFGHIGQMPQILLGFGLESACLQRGLGDEPTELWWQAPDGSRVFTIYLRDGYANAVGLPSSLYQMFASEIRRRRDNLVIHSINDQQILLMHGNDHWTADWDISKAIDYTNKHNEQIDGDLLMHSTLPAYISAVKGAYGELTTRYGELRSCRRHNLLPGVLSTRIWIKQRNHDCQALLEKWAEPFTTFASLACPSSSKDEYLNNPAPIIRKAWRYLMECHPHDSICGCSIDQVHDEMPARFDQVQQIGEEITHQSLEGLALSIDTSPPPGLEGTGIFTSVVVFNPHSRTSTDQVQVEFELPYEQGGFEIIDEGGHVYHHQLIDTQVQDLLHLSLEPQAFKNLYRQMQVGRVNGLLTTNLSVRREGKSAIVNAVMSESYPSEPEIWQRQQLEIEAMLDDPSLEIFYLTARSPELVKIVFLARDVPGSGYRSFWIRNSSAIPVTEELSSTHAPCSMENEYFHVQALPLDGSLKITHQGTGQVFPGLNRFVDGGDRGDEYNYSPPPNDRLVQKGRLISINLTRGPVCQVIEIRLILRVPCCLTQDRQARSEELVDLPIVTRASLTEGVPRLDFQTQVDNRALDHRLRVHFSLPFRPEAALYDGHFEIVKRSLDLPPFDNTWPEQPRPEMPQRAFTTPMGPGLQLLLANRGLPEIQVVQYPDGGDLALTLLRCVGWLSRDDFPERSGPAGPILPTPKAQMQGLHTFDYSLILSENGDLKSFQQAYTFNIPMRAAQTGLHSGTLKDRASFLELEPPEFVISAIKMSEDGKGMVIRGYNISSETIHIHLKPWHNFMSVFKTNLAEDGGEKLDGDSSGCVRLKVNPHEIVTLKFCTIK
jgi:mannosylglycerate hydrolase